MESDLDYFGSRHSSFSTMPMYAGGTVQGHPLIQIPVPHETEHPGLAQFTSSSIIPCLRFYSFTFRVLVLFGLALLIISRPLFQLIHKHGWKAPEVFRNQTGLDKYHANYRSNNLYTDLSPEMDLGLSVLHEFILNSISKFY